MKIIKIIKIINNNNQNDENDKNKNIVCVQWSVYCTQINCQ